MALSLVKTEAVSYLCSSSNYICHQCLVLSRFLGHLQNCKRQSHLSSFTLKKNLALSFVKTQVVIYLNTSIYICHQCLELSWFLGHLQHHKRQFHLVCLIYIGEDDSSVIGKIEVVSYLYSSIYICDECL